MAPPTWRRSDAGDGSPVLPVLTSALLSAVPGVVHGVTRRVVGLGRADGNVGFGSPRDADDAWAMRQLWCAAIGLAPERLAALRQVHGARVLRAGRREAGRGALPGSEPLGDADALIAAEPGVALLTLHADCLPILLCDPAVPAVASVHAGWRGTVADVVGTAVKEMVAAYGCRPHRMIAYFAPAIGRCCYEVGPEVAAAWTAATAGQAPAALSPAGPRWHFDLVEANRFWLARAGLDPEAIETSGICTRCRGEEWFSHRGQGADTGRFAAIIALR